MCRLLLMYQLSRTRLSLQRQYFGCLGLLGAVLFSASALGIAPAALADARVVGNVAAVQLELQEGTVSEALASLAGAFNMTYRSDVPLDQPIAGKFTGKLDVVLKRLLEGYDYSTKRSHGAIEVVIVRRSGTANQGGSAISDLGSAAKPSSNVGAAPNAVAPQSPNATGPRFQTSISRARSAK